MDLPDNINFDNEKIYGFHIDFVRECYPDGELSSTITERGRHKIKHILKEVAYSQFMEKQQENAGDGEAE